MEAPTFVYRNGLFDCNHVDCPHSMAKALACREKPMRIHIFPLHCMLLQVPPLYAQLYVIDAIERMRPADREGF